MKTIKVKPAKTLAIELEDKTYVCYFNMLAIANMQERLSSIHKKMTEISPAHMVSMILWSGINAGGKDEISEDEATALAVNLSPKAYGTIMDLYFSSIMDDLEEDEAAEVKKAITLQIASLMN